MMRGHPLEENNALRHSEPGCVSMALRGSGFLITLSAAPHLDTTMQACAFQPANPRRVPAPGGPRRG